MTIILILINKKLNDIDNNNINNNTLKKKTLESRTK